MPSMKIQFFFIKKRKQLININKKQLKNDNKNPKNQKKFNNETKN